MTTTLTITLVGDQHGNVSVRTDMATPTPGAPLTPVQSVGLDLLTHCRHARHDIQHGVRYVPALSLAQDLTSPEMYGWAVPAEIRQHASNVLTNSQEGAAC